MTFGTGGAPKDTPSTNSLEYDTETVTSGNPEPVFSEADETRSVVLVANPNNGDLIFFGFDDNVSSTQGIPLDAGGSIAIGLDVSEQNVFVDANSGTQTYHFASLE